MRKQTVGERHILSGACLMAHATNMVVPSTEVMDKAEEAGLGSETGSLKALLGEPSGNLWIWSLGRTIWATYLIVVCM